ncbi:MAG TPA: M56 family metallopeptidase [Bryobacteraceae bacterium]|nr:M56 family metallopeptidase [Bryobacteraceae bacterium]
MDLSSALLLFLAGATVRSLALAVLPLALVAWRVKSAAARHAVLFLVTAGMLALVALTPLLPALPVPVLHAAAPAAPLPSLAIPAGPVGDTAAVPVSVPEPPAPLVPRLLAALYLAGLGFWLLRLLFGSLFTRRLIRGARSIESDWGAPVYESSWISVPLTVGWFHPRILLPVGWQAWESIKLQAVLVHERNHIRRGDWAIALLAAVNRSLYWFNPLAWWLERRLAALAEEACDDAALLALGQRESYAQALLDMAAAVKTGQGRLVWDAMAMAKGKEVRMRIERILDDNRQIPRGLTRSRWLALVAASLPLIYLTAALRPVPAAAQDQTPAAIAGLLQHRPNLTAGDAAQIEQYLVTNPNDLAAREKLVLYYFSAGVREPRLSHIYWLIANHPESNEAAITSQGITPRATRFNTTADYDRAAALWQQQAAAHPNDEAVLTHAGAFFAQPGGDPNEAERLFQQVRALDPRGSAGADHLSRLYAAAILGTFGDLTFPNDNPDFGNRVRSQIEDSTDGPVLQMTGSQLVSAVRFPASDGRALPSGVVNLNEHPLLVPAQELGVRLRAAGSKILGQQFSAGDAPFLQRQRARLLSMMTTQGNSQPGPNGPGPRYSSVQEAYSQLPVLPSAPTPLSSAPPAYPPLAKMARIQGTVSLAVAISPDGHITNLTVLRGHPLLVQAALEAVKQWVYPAVSQASAFEQQVTFTLPPGAASAPPPPPPVPAANGESKPPVPQRIKIGGNVQAAMLLKKVDPEYPALAQQAGIQGTVTLAIVIAKDGTVESTTPVEGHPLLVAAAQAAVQQWTYKPTLLNGEPVEVSTTVSVPFQLQP